ncbi:DUF4926 domain-containing protein [Listeria booriae]|uniref:DUF4926 domain-containing protein n=1 Tax=Listeria booriae TaxID=1552123 RepID=UPI0016252CFA|nr:DUF4926 domain-containing protein [Listeria booriae]MBC2265068.1 DUF4926 domain-containing protein [Listeria booriae]
MKFKEFDTVKILANFTDDGVYEGEIGTILLAYTEPSEAYEIEVNNEDGTQKAQIVALPDQLELLRSSASIQSDVPDI